jgi:hypothetical protein
MAIEYSADNSYNIGTMRSDVLQYTVKGHLQKMVQKLDIKNVEVSRESLNSNIIFVSGLTGDNTVTTIETRP